jgi:hypothetical protein
MSCTDNSWVLNATGLTTQELWLLTFIHCSARRPPDAEPQLPDRPSRLPATRSRHDYSWRLRSLVRSGWAPCLGSPRSERPPPERVLAAWQLHLHRLGGSSGSLLSVSGVKFSTGTADGISFPSASAPVDKNTSVSVNMRLRLLPKVLRLQQSTHLQQCWPRAAWPR